MTDKFAICNMGLNGSFIKENGKIMEIERVVDLLNEQHEQIERLKDNFRALDEVKCELADENEKLKQALREQLEENGNAYCIEILDKIFDLKYDEWQRKMNETHTYDYIDWENVLNDKGDV